jgi:hypothetical protein
MRIKISAGYARLGGESVFKHKQRAGDYDYVLPLFN